MRTHTFPSPYPTWPIHAIDPRGFTPWEHEPDEFDRQADEDCDGAADDGPFCPACDGTAYMLDGSRCPLCNDPETVAEFARDPLSLVPAHSRWNALSGDVG